MKHAWMIEIEQLLNDNVLSATPVAGGDINLAYCAQLASGHKVFVKTHTAPAVSLYLREAEGLTLLHKAQALRIPNVLAVSERMLVLEWIEISRPHKHFDERLGHGLAKLHRASLPTFGLAHDNFLGSLPQINTPIPVWSDFYRERRLYPLIQYAHKNKIIDKNLFKRSMKLCERLHLLCGSQESIARLHGDLWSGNIICDKNGSPTLIDPAVYGGHREIDLAMLRLFDSPSPRFFAAYEEIYPLDSEANERIPLYQIYPLLAHICLFGKSYIPSLITALKHYE
ncbi:MAG: fructosamine kinase family protein [Pseudomonadota bacterium]